MTPHSPGRTGLMFQPTEETANLLLQTSGALSLELDLYARRGEQTADPQARWVELARSVIGGRLLALLSTMASQRASYDPGARVLIAFLYQPARGCPKQRRFTPPVEDGLTRRLALVPAHPKYGEALSQLAEEFCGWAIREEGSGFIQDEEENLYLLCLPLKPSLADFTTARFPL